jgi:hypothetical protein
MKEKKQIERDSYHSRAQADLTLGLPDRFKRVSEARIVSGKSSPVYPPSSNNQFWKEDEQRVEQPLGYDVSAPVDLGNPPAPEAYSTVTPGSNQFAQTPQPHPPPGEVAAGGVADQPSNRSGPPTTSPPSPQSSLPPSGGDELRHHLL